MARIKFGPECESGPLLRPMPFLTGQIFHELGNAFVHVETAGNMELTLTATTKVFGWAVLGFSVGQTEVTGNLGSRIFTVGATGDEHLVKILTGSDVFWTTGDDTFASATHRGEFCDLIGVNDGTKQQTDIGTGSTEILRINDGSGTEILVSVNVLNLQGAQV